jgi:hypothetical protein
VTTSFDPDAASAKQRAEIQRAQRHTRHGVDPKSLSQADLRRIPGQPKIAPALSYSTQQYRLTWRGTPMLLQTGTQPGRPRGPRSPITLLSAWNPGGQRFTFTENDAAHRQLWAHVHALNLRSSPVVTQSPDLNWFERGLAIKGLTELETVGLARQFGQPAVVHWSSGQLRMLPTGLRADIEASTLPATLTAASASCPVRDDDSTTERCCSRGGPYGSSAIHAGALSHHHRSVAVTLLGCQPCHNGTLPIHGPGGGAISLSQITIASRYAGATWR